jgi:hypothetical protein
VIVRVLTVLCSFGLGYVVATARTAQAETRRMMQERLEDRLDRWRNGQ